MATLVSAGAEGCRRSTWLRTGDGGRGIWPPPCPVAPASSGGSIEIEFAAGARMRITGTVDAATLTAAVAAPQAELPVVAAGMSVGSGLSPFPESC
jgi:hypothetical protein